MTKTELEAAIDAHGLCAILEAISDIACEKAEHVACNWDDPALAKAWNKAAFIVAGASADVNTKAGAAQVGHAKNNSIPARAETERWSRQRNKAKS